LEALTDEQRKAAMAAIPDPHQQQQPTATATRKLSYRKDDRAMRPTYGRPENFQESLTTPTATFP